MAGLSLNLTAEQRVELRQIIADLSELTSLSSNAQAFVADQKSRLDQWGDRMYISQKQYDWLKSLHNEHVGTLEQESKGMLEGDDEDEIRF